MALPLAPPLSLVTCTRCFGSADTARRSVLRHFVVLQTYSNPQLANVRLRVHLRVSLTQHARIPSARTGLCCNLLKRWARPVRLAERDKEGHGKINVRFATLHWGMGSSTFFFFYAYKYALALFATVVVKCSYQGLLKHVKFDCHA